MRSGLILETSASAKGAEGCIAIVQDSKILFYQSLEGGAALSRNLGSQLELLLQKTTNFCPQFVAVGVGPGSYTGIRVGVALAKSLAFGWGCPLIGFCSLEARFPSGGAREGDFVIIEGAREEEVYAVRGKHSLEKTIFYPSERMHQKDLQEISWIVRDQKIDKQTLLEIALKRPSQSPLSLFSIEYGSLPSCEKRTNQSKIEIDP